MVENTFHQKTKVLNVNELLERELNHRQPHVLIVDDEHHILRAIKRLFSGHEWEVLTASDGAEALEILDTHEIAVLVSDQRMPGISGVALLNHARDNFPKTVRVMVTGNNDIQTAIDAINQGEVFRFVNKPWNNDDLVRVITSAVEFHQLLVAKDIYEAHIQRQNEELVRWNEELEERVEERTLEVVEKSREIESLFTELEGSFDATIQALFSIMELGNIAIVHHCRRTAARSVQLAHESGLDPEWMRHLERAALLHWLGLINAPRQMFKKSVDNFDAVELATWEFYPLLSQQAIAHVPALKQAGLIILYHHRNYDDPDFQPAFFKDEVDQEFANDFIRCCQILHICTHFEYAKTIREQMKNKWVGVEEGIALLQAGRGTRFHPELVELLISSISREVYGEGRGETLKELDELQPGMVLSRPIETQQGIPVAPRDMVVTGELIERLRRFKSTNGIKEIWVTSS